MNIVLIIIGLVLLVVGGEFLVRSSVALSFRLKLSKLVIGMTVVSFATSAPELLVSLQAALDGVSDIALGNVIGSNIINIAFVGGISSFISDITFRNSDFYSSNIILIFITFLLLLLLFQKELINRFLGAIFSTSISEFVIVFGTIVEKYFSMSRKYF